MLINREIWRKLSPLSNPYNMRFSLSERTTLIILGVVIGALASLGNAAFRYTMDLFTNFFFNRLAPTIGVNWPERSALIFILPVIGAAISGIFVSMFSDDAKGYGLPRVILALTKKAGLIKKRVIVFNIFLPTLVIGSGGSAGREGPIASLGAAVGSLIGQMIKANPQRMRIIVASGAGAAIAAAFDAPIAGMMFALEIILLGNFDVEHFPPLVISVGTAVVITQALYGSEVTFHIPPFSILNPWIEFPIYAFIGIVIGLASVFFIRFYYFVEEQFDKIKQPLYTKLLIGAFLTGVIGIIFPEVLGNGYEFVEEALQNGYSFWLMGLLGLAKIAATAFTVGSGNPGGLFAPGFFIGAMIAGFFGGLLSKIIPVATASAGAYASVGIGAFISGTYHAPLTGIFLLFEMTKDYTIILPALFACVIASIISERFLEHNIDTYGLALKGIKIKHGREKEILESLKVGDAMSKDYDTIWEGANLRVLKDYFGRFAKHTDLFVVDSEGRLVGVIPFNVLKNAIFTASDLEDVILARDLAVDAPKLKKDQPLTQAMENIGKKKVDHLPVVDEDGKVIGMISRRGIVDAYTKESIKRRQG